MTASHDQVADSKAQRKQTAGLWCWVNLGILLIAYIFSFIDRSIVSLMVEPLKQDLALSDTQVSLLHGFAFAVFYTFLGIPIARLADAYSRKVIIAIGVTIWSAATCLCGFAGKFMHLFIARIGVGVGEAALSPAAYSMISDMFPRRQLGRALGVYTMGLYLGAGIAYLAGGQLMTIALDSKGWMYALFGDMKPWQMVFIVVGAPGLLVAVMVAMMREPARILQRDNPAVRPMSEVFVFVQREKATFINHFIGFSLLGLVFNAFLAWLPSLMIRQLDFSISEAGFHVGISIFVFGTLGILAGGYHTDRLVQRGVLNAPIKTGFLAALWLLPVGVALPLVTTIWIKLTLLALFFFWSAFPYAAAAAAIQMASPPHLKAQVSALYLFCLNLIGIGLGGTLVALITDGVFADDNALPKSLAITVITCIPAGIYVLFRCKQPFGISVQRRDAELNVTETS